MGLQQRLRFGACLIVIGLGMAGCGSGDRPPLGYVTGTVTIDGEPLSGVIVTFMPETGRAAVGISDEKGKYEIEYLEGAKGAKVGPTSVVFMAQTGVPSSHPIPAKYQSATDEFKVDVKDGNNVFDFKLESGQKGSRNVPQSRPGRIID